MAAALGIPIHRYKVTAFVVSSAVTAVAGSLFAYYRGFVSVEAFSLFLTIQYVATDPDGMPLVWSLDSVAMANTEAASYNGASLQGQVRARLGEIPAELSGFFTPQASGFIPPVPKADFDAAVAAAGLVERFHISKTFVLGSGDSGLGFDAERGMVGMMVNDTRTIHSEHDKSRDYSQIITRERWLGEAEPLSTTIEQATFEQNLGEPTVGQVFAYNNLFQAEVVSFDGTEVCEYSLNREAVRALLADQA